jgi:hypothetical protein
MTGQLERPDSRNDRKAGMTGKPVRRESRNDWIDLCANILAEGMFVSWIGIVGLIIEISRIFWGFTWHYLHVFIKNIGCGQYIGKIIIERDIFVFLCLLLKNHLLILLDWAETEIRFLQENDMFKMNHSRSQSNDCHLPYPSYFSLLSTFKRRRAVLNCDEKV